MNIQVVSNNGLSFDTNHKITGSTLNKPVSLDTFDINIFSLQYDELWKYKGSVSTQLFCSNDLASIKTMIATSQKAINIVALPQNYKHYYAYWEPQKHYEKIIELKNELPNLKKNLLSSIIPDKFTNSYGLIYENSETVLNNKSFVSAFCFEPNFNELTKSQGGNKPTTIQFGKLILTTLNLESPNTTIDDFIKGIGLEDKKIEYPQWLIDYTCFDDEQQQKTIDSYNQKIQELNEKINQSRLKLEENLKFKSILSTNGDELVEVVFEILEKLLACDLSGFIDEKKQDFLIKKDSITFIGEIKGITSNVKSENVSQLDVHYHSYLDELRENNISENVKQLLIINPFRTKPLAERDAVHEIQINLAKRNGSLIITTETLLKIFEKFLNDDVTSEKIMSVFSTRIGLLPIEAFYEEKEKVDNSAYQMQP